MKIFNQEAFPQEQLNAQNQTIASTLEEAMSFVKPIPDQLVFTHELFFKDQCYFKQEESIFTQIPGIGDLHLGGFVDIQCCACQSINCGNCNCSCFRCTCCACFLNCDCCGCCSICGFEYTHYYPGPLYTLENDIIKFQHFGQKSTLYVKGQLALEFSVSHLNFPDILYGGCYSGYPHILFKNPNHISNPTVYFKPGENKCPTEPCVFIPGCCVICSLCGISQREKEISIGFFPQNPLYQPNCKIITRRTKKIACYQQCGCKEYCNIVNYPTIEIQFQNVNQIDRLGIIMSAIHYSISDYWSRYNWYGRKFFNIPVVYETEKDF